MKNDNAGVLIRYKHGSQFGKLTAVTIALDKNPENILIITAKPLIHYWVEYLKRFDPERFIPCVPRRSTKEKVVEIKKFLKTKEESKTKVVLLNYESVWRPGLGPVRHKFYRLIDKGVIGEKKWDVIILDHCEKIKNNFTLCSKFIHRLHGKKRIAISRENLCEPLFFHSIYKFLDRNIFGLSFARFKHEYFIFGGFFNTEIVGYKNQTDFIEKAKSIVIDESES